MITTVLSPVERKVNVFARELSEQGYDVLVSPSHAEFPFDLQAYLPSLVATKGSEGIVLEVKESLHNVSVDRFQTISEIISSREGWRFLLTTVDGIRLGLFPLEPDSLLDWVSMERQVTQFDCLIELRYLEAALLLLWRIIEAALRRRAVRQHLPIERFIAVGLISHSYSSGEIWLTEFELFKQLLSLRNQVAHGRIVTIDIGQLKEARNHIAQLIEQWRDDENN